MSKLALALLLLGSTAGARAEPASRYEVAIGPKAEVLAVSRKFMELHQQYWPGWEGASELYEIEEYS